MVLAWGCTRINFNLNIFKNHVIKRLPGRHEGQTGRSIDPHVEKDWHVVIVEQKLSHFLFNFFRIFIHFSKEKSDCFWKTRTKEKKFD